MRCKWFLAIIAFVFALLSAFILTLGASNDGSSGALSSSQAKAFYDHFGILQDTQWFYEGPPVEEMARQCGIPIQGDGEETTENKKGKEDQKEEDGIYKKGHKVLVEYGFGTGAFAEKVLKANPGLQYIGVDISDTMYDITSKRLRDFGSRVRLYVSEDPIQSIQKKVEDGSATWITSSFVFDLMSEAEAAKVIAVLRSKLKSPVGRICATSLAKFPSLYSKESQGIIASEGWILTSIAKIVSVGFHVIWRWCPMCVGGCRPVSLKKFFELSDQQLPQSCKVGGGCEIKPLVTKWMASRGFPSEVVVYEKQLREESQK